MSPPRAAATNRKPHGQIRQSQIVTTFGPGAMVDLPDHAVIIGEKITAFGGHPSIKVQPVPETNKHNVLEILKEGMAFEKASLSQYLGLLSEVEGEVALEELIRQLIKEETEHIEEVEKMTRVLDR